MSCQCKEKNTPSFPCFTLSFLYSLFSFSLSSFLPSLLPVFHLLHILFASFLLPFFPAQSLPLLLYIMHFHSSSLSHAALSSFSPSCVFFFFHPHHLSYSLPSHILLPNNIHSPTDAFPTLIFPTSFLFPYSPLLRCPPSLAPSFSIFLFSSPRPFF